VEFASSEIKKKKKNKKKKKQFQQSKNVSFFFLSLEINLIGHVLENLERCFGGHVSRKGGRR
jgi:hypothetical protein